MDKKADAVEILPGGDWMSAKWRPAMGWMYMAVCIFDFIIFPILWTLIQAYDAQGSVTTEWDPLTLKGGGLFHVAMGAVLGVAAWSRGQEKITAMNQGYDTSGPAYAPHEHYSQPTQRPSITVPPKVPVAPVVRPPYAD
jgi:hypothetical protein